MSGSSFYLLPTNKLYNKEKTRRLKNFPAGCVGNFYRNLADNIDNFTGFDFYSIITADTDLPKKMLKNIFWPLLTLQKVSKLTLITM